MFTSRVQRIIVSFKNVVTLGNLMFILTNMKNTVTETSVQFKMQNIMIPDYCRDSAVCCFYKNQSIFFINTLRSY